MVANIVPVGNGQAGDRSGCCRIGFYVLGTMLGGFVLGGVLTSLGALLQETGPVRDHAKWLPILFGALFFLLSAGEVGLVQLPLPQSVRQVPRSWFWRFGANAGSVAWGAFLGLGFLTPVVCLSFYAVVFWILLMVGRDVGLALTLAYSIGRAMPVISIWLLSSRSGHDRVWYLTKVEPLSGVIFVINGMLLASLGSFLLTAALYR